MRISHCFWAKGIEQIFPTPGPIKAWNQSKYHRVFFFIFRYFYYCLTLFQHPKRQTLLKTAVLTADTVVFINLTWFVLNTGVLELFLNCSFEKTFTSFTALNTIMKPRWTVSTNGTYTTCWTKRFFHLWNHENMQCSTSKSDCD